MSTYCSWLCVQELASHVRLLPAHTGYHQRLCSFSTAQACAYTEMSASGATVQPRVLRTMLPSKDCLLAHRPTWYIQHMQPTHSDQRSRQPTLTTA